MNHRRPPISKKVLADIQARVREKEPSSSRSTPWIEQFTTWLLMSSFVGFALWILAWPVVAGLDWFTDSNLLPAWSNSGLIVIILFLLFWIWDLGTTAPVRSALAIAGCLLAIGTALDLHVGPISLRAEEILIYGFWSLFSLDQIVLLWALPHERGRWWITFYTVLGVLAGSICIVRLWPVFLPSLTLLMTRLPVHQVVVLMGWITIFLRQPAVQHQFRRSPPE